MCYEDSGWFDVLGGLENTCIQREVNQNSRLTKESFIQTSMCWDFLLNIWNLWTPSGRSHVSFRHIGPNNVSVTDFRWHIPFQEAQICYLKYNVKLLSCGTDPNFTPCKYKLAINVAELTSSPFCSKESQSKENWPCTTSPLRRTERTLLPTLWQPPRTRLSPSLHRPC